MIVLTVRTDREEAELGLFTDGQRLSYIKWQAHRQLTATIHQKIQEILNKSSISLNDINGIIVFQGLGSFTGLRIGCSVANSLAFSLHIPIVASRGNHWLEQGLKRIKAGEDDKIVTPFYGQPVHITKPKK